MKFMDWLKLYDLEVAFNTRFRIKPEFKVSTYLIYCSIKYMGSTLGKRDGVYFSSVTGNGDSYLAAFKDLVLQLEEISSNNKMHLAHGRIPIPMPQTFDISEIEFPECL